MASWLLRFIKGIFVGSGFILPGISGGALAAVFGLYERMVTFMANIRKDFKENVLFFIPVGVGGVFGIFIFAVLLSRFLEIAEIPLIWFFIGCIVGTLPTLWKQAGTLGRKSIHIITLVISTIVAFAFLWFIDHAVAGAFPLNIYTWVLAGALIGMSVTVPGLSSSSLLIFLQMYRPMMDGISSFNFSIIIPMGVGGLITVFVSSRFMSFMLRKAHSALFHAIIGFVVASTVLIIPVYPISNVEFDYISLNGVICAVAAIMGIVAVRLMCRFEVKDK